MSEQRVRIDSDLDIVTARVMGREMAQGVGFGVIDQARVATAISELARNVVLYAESGEVVIREVEGDDGRRGVEVVVEDEGPGIEDLELALRNGYSTGRGFGMGLPGTRRLMDEFEVETRVGKGTKVTVRKWLP
ncbi:MAG: anti-sigma regulatory factor [Chloroflexota bacterium]|nr:anti-sigma regulatory factor [Chloroflexota bacterium]